MENNEIMNNEEVMETATEEIVKATSNSSCLGSVTKIGLAMVAGGLICKFVVEPGVKKLKHWAEDRTAKKVVGEHDTNDVVEDNSVEASEEETE